MKNLTRVAGGKDDFQLVHHLTLSGGQFEIGRALAEEARRLGWSPYPVDPVVGRARRTWFERHWPQQHARMDGAAAALGLDPEQDELALDGLAYVPGLSGVPEGTGCSALWIPPSAAADGHGRIGRNYDFFPTTTSEIMGGSPRPGELPMASRPYVITTLPDEGPATTVITMNELDGCMDGVNAAGLAVMLLVADFESAAPPESTAPQVGVSSVQLPRFLLETCENTDQAKQALLGAKQYDHGMPLHYLVADANGRAFVWERGRDGGEHIVEFGDGPLCVTNHLLHRNPDPMHLPPDGPGSFRTYHRLRTLYERSKGATMSGEDLRAALREVAQPEDPAAPFRTLWSTVFDTAERTLSTRFYLGDGRPCSEELVFSPPAAAR
ncbi:C45 family autoproteolytic acyltransferase/hydrolase [Actinomadura sp. ATCC 31491]|uniref:C45 family autoproteolytic acyltransferase/hydrolase n=1 Tax=Actinomadura luzonensis TaxID=2805427 RepID=A0ABT0G0D9_9ACTN|nr:C45 family peptidase [Actinomadura luzonensis]MCK2217603.1 C45 family autoproteolytic acyltransferase/hydrolase [Actinomadura luzonensis]